MMKKALILVLFAALAMGAAAQTEFKSPFSKRFAWGVELGGGSSHQQYTSTEVTGKPGDSWVAGLAGYLNVARDFSLLVQPQYEWRRQRNPAGHFRTDNITLPLTVCITNNDSKGPFHYFVGLGGYWSNALWGQCDGAPLDYKNSYYRGEWGWQGYLALFHRNFGVSLTPRQSLTDMRNIVPDGQPNWRVWSVYATLSWVF